MTTTAFITHPDCRLHDMGGLHPESPERLTAINDRLIASGIEAYLSSYEAPRATEEQILRAHSKAHYDSLLENAPAKGVRRIDPDTAMNEHTLQAMHHAAGAGILAVDLIMRGEIENAFCAIRPPGHHAERERAMGFCFINNIAIAAHHALAEHQLERVAIVDIDVHHGNGTEDIFRDDPRVLMTSFFQHPFFPYSGHDTALDHMVNVPVKAGMKGDGFQEIVTNQMLPAIKKHNPQMVFISAGFDAHYEDDMGSCGLLEKDYIWFSEQLMQTVRGCGHKRIVSMLEGGYAPSALGRAVVAHIKAIAEL